MLTSDLVYVQTHPHIHTCSLIHTYALIHMYVFIIDKYSTWNQQRAGNPELLECVVQATDKSHSGVFDS